MKRINNKKNLYKSIILLVILVIGIGYAYLTSNLSISGNTEVVTNTWNIHFENLNISTGSVTASTGASINASGDAISYTINLNRPKEYYEFTVDVKNDGTLPGKVSISSLSGLDTTSSKVIDYSIAYTNGNSVNVGDILNADSKKTIKVRVYYKDEINPSDFPATDLNLNLTYTLQYIQSEKDEVTIDSIIHSLKTDNSTCFTKYEGQVTDQVGETVTASNVYYDKCTDKRNIIFNNMCWQMIRTTETGGVKMLYNGVPEENKCESTRSNHLGMGAYQLTFIDLQAKYLYGSSFTYDETTNNFVLSDTIDATWSDSTYKSLIGKYTCKNMTGTCTSLYSVNGYRSSTAGYVSNYGSRSINYSFIAESTFNANGYSPAMVGYMFNNVYNNKEKSISSNTKFGSTFIYDENSNTYTVSGTIQNISNIYGSDLKTTHYTCWNESGVCDTISFIFYASVSAFYIDINNGKSINDALNEMLFNDDVNKYNSTIKGLIDNWYKNNLTNKTNMIEDAVYCGARNTSGLGGWHESGNVKDEYIELKFKNYNGTKDLSCTNITDQFSVSNNKARLTYPVALLQEEERYSIGNTLLYPGGWFWLLSPADYNLNALIKGLSTYINNNYSSNNVGGIRPVISLKADNVISEGDGSETNPWIIE